MSGVTPGMERGAHAAGTAATPSEQQAADNSLGDLVSTVTRDMSTLIRQEIELAKAELTQSGKRVGKGSGLLGGAAIAGYLTILFLSLAAWVALGVLIGLAWSAVVVAAFWAIVAVVLAITGKGEFDRVKGMPQTVDTMREIPDTLKRNEENR
jgi:tetrahydromethanopterin S-methyltransferase subunit G